MTNKLEDFFDVEKTPDKEIQTFVEVPQLPLDTISELADTRQHDADMDLLATEAMKTFEMIIEIANNSDERNVGHILATAVQIHKNALDAKESKTRMRLQAANLLMRKKAMDDKAALADASVIEEEPQDSNDVIGDRNQILEIIRSQSAISKDTQ